MPSKPGVVTTSNGNIYIDAKLHSQFGDDTTALNEELGNILNSPYNNYILGDTGGETYRQFHTAGESSDPASRKDVAQSMVSGTTGKTVDQTYSDLIAQNPYLQSYFGQGDTTDDMSEATKKLIAENVNTQMGDSAIQTSDVARALFGDIGQGLDFEQEQYEGILGGTTTEDVKANTETAAAFEIGQSSFGAPTTESMQTAGGLDDLSSYGISSNNASGALTAEQRSLYEGIQRLNQETYDTSVQQIQKFVQQQTAATQTEQRQAMGASRAALARMRALQVTSAGVQYMNDLQSEYVDKLNNIVQQGITAINTAQQAKSSADLELLSKQLETLRQNRLDYQTEVNSYMDNLYKMEQVAQMKRDNITNTIDAMAAAGLTEQDLPTGYASYLDRSAGYVEGTTLGLLNVANRERAMSETVQQMELESMAMQQAADLNTYLDSVPLGEIINVNGVQYYGRSTNGVEVGSDGVGRRYVTLPNGSVAVEVLGQITTPESNLSLQFDDNGYAWAWDSQTNTLKPAGYMGQGVGAGADAALAWNQILPNGTDFNWYDERDGDYFGGQCGEFVRWATGGTVTCGDSLESKIAITDPTIGQKGNPVRVGDVVVTNEGGWTGHIGIIESVTEGPDGETYLSLMESNFNLDGKVNHGRSIKMSSSAIQGFARGELNPALQTGSSTVSNGGYVPTFGAPSPRDEDFEPDLKIKEQPYILVDGEYVPIPVAKTPEQEQQEREAAYQAELQREADVYKIQDHINRMNRVLENPALSDSVGPNFFARRPSGLSSLTGDYQEFVGDIATLISQETLNALVSAKARDATFGALSETELEILGNAATSINEYKKEFLGVTYFAASEETFIREVERLRSMAELAIKRINGKVPPSKEQVQSVYGDLAPGQVYAQEKSTGTVGILDESEYDPNKYTLID